MQADLAVVAMPVASLIPYAANARTHSDAQVGQIAASIAEFGFVNPVLVDSNGVLVAGHGRVLAAKRLGLTSVPAIRLQHLSDAQVRALRLADNQIALNSGWDEALLAAELARIRDDGVVDLDVMGFSSREIDDLLASIDGDGDATLDEVPHLRRRQPRAPAIFGFAVRIGCCAAMPPSWRICSAPWATNGWPTWRSPTRRTTFLIREARQQR